MANSKLNSSLKYLLAILLIINTAVTVGSSATTVPITTKIVGFTSFEFLPLALRWYDKLTSLGYDNHFIVATDNSSDIYLEALPGVRHETEIRPGAVKTLYAARIKYIKKQLLLGYHLLLTDVDNIFDRFVDTSVFEKEPYDVIHAYESKFPEDVYAKQGFVVCGGMTFFRADPDGTKAYEYVNRATNTCSRRCDDQATLNRIMANDLNMVWNTSAYTPAEFETHRVLDPIFRNDSTTARLSGLDVQLGRIGVSEVTGLRIKIWDRNFAFRGPIDPKPCPKDYWVAMPIIWVRTRKEGPIFKFRQMDEWESHCEKEVVPVKK